MKKILMIGCSNLYGMHHAFRHVFFGEELSDCQQSHLDEVLPYEEKQKPPRKDLIFQNNQITITNLSEPGAGNHYIFGRLLEHLMYEQVDYCYLQFSGPRRLDIPTSINNPRYNHSAKKTRHYHWITSGGPGSQILTTEGSHIWADMYDIEKEGKDHEVMNTGYVAASINLLKYLNIPYNWTFYYNTSAPPTKETMQEGLMQISEKLIDKTKMISQSPHQWCHAQRNIEDDGVHFKFDFFVDYLLNFKNEFDLDCSNT